MLESFPAKFIEELRKLVKLAKELKVDIAGFQYVPGLGWTKLVEDEFTGELRLRFLHPDEPWREFSSVKEIERVIEETWAKCAEKLLTK